MVLSTACLCFRYSYSCLEGGNQELWSSGHHLKSCREVSFSHDGQSECTSHWLFHTIVASSADPLGAEVKLTMRISFSGFCGVAFLPKL